MRWAFLLIAMTLAATASEKPPVPQPRMVARIDALIATLSNGRLVIQARGAVDSGGWRAARLRPAQGSDPHPIGVEFVAPPPAPTRAVIQGRLPVAASPSLPMRRGVFSVRALSGSNEI